MFIDFKTVLNIRILDDIETIDGKRIKLNSFLRSGDLFKISNYELKILKEKYNLKKVIDFRSDNSFINKRDNLDDSIEYVHIRALEYLNYTPYNKNIPLPPYEFFMDIYERLAISEDGINCYKQFFKEILATNEGAILYHCTSGKDRTGVATALLLYALGCSKETIIKEHLSVNEFQQKLFDNFLKGYTPVDQEDYVFYETYYFARKEFLDNFFNCIEKRFGTIENYFKVALKLNEGDILKLRNKYLY